MKKISLMLILIIGINYSYAQEYYHDNFGLNKIISYQYFKYKKGLAFPLSQPYNTGEVIGLLKENKNSKLSVFADVVENEQQQLDSGYILDGIYANFEGFYNESIKKNISIQNSFKIKISDFYFVNTIRFDEKYKSDKNFPGNTDEWYYGRVETGYIQYRTENVDIFAGRASRNLGVSDEKSLILSDNPYSYDHIYLSWNNSLLKFSAMLARLDDIFGYDIRDSLKEEFWGTRYLSMHRLEVSPLKNLFFSLSESAIFGGKDNALKFEFVNPFNIYYLSKQNEKGFKENNVNVNASAELLWHCNDYLSLYTQVLIDDIDFKSDNRDKYPERTGYKIKMYLNNLFENVGLTFSYNRINNWTYTSFYNWGNYTYYGKGLGYPEHGVEEYKVNISYLGNSFFAEANFGYKNRREQNLSSNFIAVKTGFPYGTPEKYVFSELSGIYYLTNGLILNGSINYLYDKKNSENSIIASLGVKWCFLFKKSI